MSQLQLLDVPESKWIAHKGVFGRNVAWEHSAMPGLLIEHCGHPTALRPYYIVERPDLGTFASLAHAKQRLEESFNGKI